MPITLADNPTEAAWRKEVQQFISTEGKVFRQQQAAEGDIEGAMFGRIGSVKAWREKVAQKGWIAPSWPAKYGGADMSVAQQFIMNEEFAEAGVPSYEAINWWGILAPAGTPATIVAQ